MLAKFESYVNTSSRVIDHNYHRITDIPRGVSSLPDTVVQVSQNLVINSLQCYASIKSLAVVAIPSYPLEFSESERIIADLNLEWTSARWHLQVFLENTVNNTLFLLGQVSLLNVSPYPYRQYNLLKAINDNALPLQLGENSHLGYKLYNPGFSEIYIVSNESISDLINVSASFTKEVWVQETEIINISVPLTPTINTPVNITNNITGGSTSNSNNNNTPSLLFMLKPTITSGLVTLTSENKAVKLATVNGKIVVQLKLDPNSQIPYGSEFQIYSYNTEPINKWDASSRLQKAKVENSEGCQEELSGIKVFDGYFWLVIFCKLSGTRDWNQYGTWRKCQIATAAFNAEGALVITISGLWIEPSVWVGQYYSN